MLADQPKNENEGEPAEPPLTKAGKKKLKKLQKRQEREALLTRINIEEVQREIDMAKKTHGLANKKWKEICMKEGRSEYKDWMMEQWNLFEHLISIKDEIIRQLLEDVQIGEKRNLDRFSDQTQQTDKLLSHFQEELNGLLYRTEEEKEQTLKNREEKLKTLGEQNKYMEEYMQTIIYLINKQNTEKNFILRSEFLSKNDEEKNKTQTEYESETAYYENRIDDLIKETELILQEYKKDTEKTIKQNVFLSKRVEKEEQLIGNHVKVILNLNATIEKDRRFIQRGEPLANELYPLRKEKKELQRLYRKENNILKDYHKRSEIHLKYTVATSNDTLKYLNEVLLKGEKILKYKKICQKLETEEEQRLFERPNLRESVRRTHLWNCGKETHVMAKFWKRVGRAQRTKDFLTVRRKSLRKKNEKLKEKLKSAISKLNMSSILSDIKKCNQ